jgi:hypothetical protein
MPVFIFSTVFLVLSYLVAPLGFAKDLPDDLKRPAQKTNAVGIILGDPSGLTGKFWLSSKTAIDAGLAYSFNNFALVYADYLFHFPTRFGTSNNSMENVDPYVGIGGEIAFAGGNSRSPFSNSTGSSGGFGIRIPIGVEWLLPSAPFGVFAEFALGLGLIPATTGFLQGGIGARYYF